MLDSDNNVDEFFFWEIMWLKLIKVIEFFYDVMLCPKTYLRGVVTQETWQHLFEV